MAAATVPIADNVTRAMPAIAAAAEELQTTDSRSRTALIAGFDADEARAAAESAIREGVLS